MHSVDKQLPILDGAVGVLQVQRAGPNRLDLRTGQLNAGFIFLLNVVVMESLAVLRRGFDSLFLRRTHLFYRGMFKLYHSKLKYTTFFRWLQV